MLSHPPSQIQSSIHQNPSDLILKHHANLKNDRAILASYTQLSTPPSPATLPLVLKACGRLRNIKLGRNVHSIIITTNVIADIRVATALIDFYCKCGFLDDACMVFDEMDERDLVCWNSMVRGCIENGCCGFGIMMVLRMWEDGLKPNEVTCVSVLSACGEMGELRMGKEVHCYCLRNGFFDLEAYVGTALIGFYSKMDVGYSRKVFEVMAVRNVVSWNAAICACLNEGDGYEGLELFCKMMDGDVSPDSVTFLAVVQLCGEVGNLGVGKQVHQLVIKHGFSDDDFIGNALVDMYGKCGCYESAYMVFKKMSMRDIASWNAMLSVYKNCNVCDRGFCLFKTMQAEGIQENMITLATMLSMCDQSGDIRRGKQLHAYIIRREVERYFTIYHALLSMYSDCDCMTSADIIFHKMEKKNAVSWNTFIAGLIRNGMTCQAFDHFRHMQQTETSPNSYTMVSLLDGCKEESKFNTGRSIHGYVVRNDLDFNSSLCTALTELYMDS